MRQLTVTPSITNRDHASIDKYLSDVKNEPMISVDEEAVLALKIRNGDYQALEKLVKANLRFVVSVAKKYQGFSIPLVDLISEGNVGLIKAAQRFDETRGFKFISYAVWWIRQSIMQSIYEQSRIVRLPLNRVAEVNKMKKAFKELEQKNEREPTVEELARLLDASNEDVKRSIHNSTSSFSIDAPIQEDETTNFADLLVAGSDTDPDNNLRLESMQIDISRALTCLNKLEKDIIIQSYGIGLKQAVCQSDIAYEHHLTTERIRQIKNRALDKLKAKIKKEHIITG